MSEHSSVIVSFGVKSCSFSIAASVIISCVIDSLAIEKGSEVRSSLYLHPESSSPPLLGTLLLLNVGFEMSTAVVLLVMDCF